MHVGRCAVRTLHRRISASVSAQHTRAILLLKWTAIMSKVMLPMPSHAWLQQKQAHHHKSQAYAWAPPAAHLEHGVAQVCEREPRAGEGRQQHRQRRQAGPCQLRLVVPGHQAQDARCWQAEVEQVPGKVGQPEGGGGRAGDHLQVLRVVLLLPADTCGVLTRW